MAATTMATRRRSIGVYGGAFDPITSGHVIQLFQALATQKVDEVWIVPSGDFRDEKPAASPIHHRIQLCHLALKAALQIPYNSLPLSGENEKHCSDRVTEKGTETSDSSESTAATLPLRVVDIEMQHGRFIPTIELFRLLRQRHPQLDFWMIIGSDLLRSIYEWTQGEAVLREVKFLVVSRLPISSTWHPKPAAAPVNNATAYVPTESSLESETPVDRPWVDSTSSVPCQCGMAQSEIPGDATRIPKTWSCVKCELAERRGFSIFESNIASMETRRRILMTRRQFSEAQQQSRNTWDTKQQRRAMELQLLALLGGIITPEMIHYILDHDLYVNSVE